MKTKKAPQTTAKKNHSFSKAADAFRRKALASTINHCKKTIVNGDDDLMLHLVAATNEFEIYVDDAGDYYMDRLVSTNTQNFCRTEFGEYNVLRQRHHVSPVFALQMLLVTVIPSELLDLLPQSIFGGPIPHE